MMVAGGPRNRVAKRVLGPTGMPFLESWNETVTLHRMHTDWECSHFCSNGVLSVWIWRLWQLLTGLAEAGGEGAGGATAL